MTAAILVVEDDIELQSLVRHALASEGYDVRLTGDGEEGLALYRELGPDLLIIDMMMPQADGFSMPGADGFAKPWADGIEAPDERERVRPECPVLVLTAGSIEEDALAGIGLDASDYLMKPFMTGELRARVRALLP